MFTPSIEEVGEPKVYKQPALGSPPLTLVATARAVTTELFTPKICMKYVGWTTETNASTYFESPPWIVSVVVLGGLLICTQTVPTAAPEAVHVVMLLLLASVKPF